MTAPNKDASVFSHIEALVTEEHRLFEGGDASQARERDAGTVKKYLG